MLLYRLFKVVIFGTLVFPVQVGAIQAPQVDVLIQDKQVNISWNVISDASGYILLYAPYPYTGADSIVAIDLSESTEFKAQLWQGATFYVAVQSYKNDETSPYSNIELIQIDSSVPELPLGILMKSIQGGTFTMGNNDLMGPQRGDAMEHQVTLSNFEMSETEITNAQYIEFLNAAFTQDLIEVSMGSAGGDKGKLLIIGSSKSSYPGKVLYELSGTRVMKDHDNQDGDNDPFTGTIEPENPLNIAFIGYDSKLNQFYLKNPHDADDFNWSELTNYYHYSMKSHIPDTSEQLNDLNNWDELIGWTIDNPEAAKNLPSQTQVADYPVTFVRWWGAFAFSEFYAVRLPTEAQWEYAAKAGQDYFYAVFDGETVNDANWNQTQLNPAEHHVRAAKSGQANPFGLYNLAGNVWEWMADHYQAYSAAAVTDPLVEITDSTIRVWRGGSWNYHQATLESSARYYDDENRGNDHFGFRIVR